ncbi:MAG: hypothetical protein CO113_16760 [Elusimicrobia bacterium CG_4_9_14_3_um_filter_62_55]|nr:MAG: hypothetical protein CO113_16760 [Elusimicrobia bacterium CG_4_9_14_3_um_filter_62_55]
MSLPMAEKRHKSSFSPERASKAVTVTVSSFSGTSRTAKAGLKPTGVSKAEFSDRGGTPRIEWLFQAPISGAPPLASAAANMGACLESRNARVGDQTIR